MKAIFTSKLGHRVIVEPMNNQTEQQLIKKTKQIMRKRNIETEIEIINEK